MPDVYAKIAEVDTQIQERLAGVLETRFTDPRQQAMLHAYLRDIDFPEQAKVLEIGCGTGFVTRTLAQWPGVGEAVGVDPSSVFIEKARVLSEKILNISFEVGDGRSLRFAPDMFDVIVVHTTLCHVPDPQLLLHQAFRLLKPQGWIAVFDGDYSTATVAFNAHDPLEVCMAAFRENFVHDPWLVRRLPSLMRAAGFELMPMRSHGYVEAGEGAYMLSWVDRGADTLLNAGSIGKETAEAMKAEAQRRSAAKIWFGHIAFASVLGRKP